MRGGEVVADSDIALHAPLAGGGNKEVSGGNSGRIG